MSRMLNPHQWDHPRTKHFFNSDLTCWQYQCRAHPEVKFKKIKDLISVLNHYYTCLSTFIYILQTIIIRIYIYEQPLYMTLDRVLICTWQFKGLHLFILKCWTWYILSLILKLCLMVSQCPRFPAIIDQSTCLFLALMNPRHRSGKKDKYGSWARDNCRNNH